MTSLETGRQTLGDRYALEEVIATGGMGQVWRGRDLLLERSVAVKVLRSEYADDPTFLARFRNEARHAAALGHPNIATVLDYGEDSDDGTGEHLAYLVMELVEGAPLSTRIRDEGALDTDTALSVLRQAAAGLAEAHRAGVVHRDVKPSNILVRRDGRVKLTDFGIAWSAECVPLTQTGQVIGTAQYMSPEQAAGERVSPASDVYALGLVGYESLTGHAAFSGTNPVTVALKQVREQPEPLPDDLPPGVRDLIGAALTKDPGARLPDGAAFLHAVEGTLEQRSEPVPPTTPVALAAPGAGTAHRPRVPSPPRRAGRRRLVAVLSFVALLLVAGGVVLVTTRSGEAPAPEAAETGPQGIVLTAADYVGRPVTEVVDALTALGLTVGQRSETTAEAAPGTVLAVAPLGEELAPGDRAEVLVAVPAETAVPAPEPTAPGGATGGATGEAPPAPAPGTPEATATPEPTTGTPEDTGAAPGSTAPGSTAPGSTAPGTTAETTASGSTAPDSTAPDSTAPDSTAPVSTAPDSTASDSSAAGSSAAEDGAVGSPAPAPGTPQDTATPEATTGTPEDTTTPPATGTGTPEDATAPPSSGTGEPTGTGSASSPASAPPPDTDGTGSASGPPARGPAPAGASGRADRPG